MLEPNNGLNHIAEVVHVESALVVVSFCEVQLEAHRDVLEDGQRDRQPLKRVKACRVKARYIGRDESAQDSASRVSHTVVSGVLDVLRKEANGFFGKLRDTLWELDCLAHCSRKTVSKQIVVFLLNRFRQP